MGQRGTRLGWGMVFALTNAIYALSCKDTPGVVFRGVDRAIVNRGLGSKRALGLK